MHLRTGYSIGMLLLLLACHKTPGVEPAGTEDPHVLLLVLDGVRTEEFTTTWKSDLTSQSGESFAGEAWDALSGDALVVREALTVGLASTAPGHATLVTGRDEPVMTVPYVEENPGVYRPELPTIFEEARKQNGWPESEAMLLADSVVMPSSTYSLAPGFGGGASWNMLEDMFTGEVEDDDRKVLDEMKKVVNQGPHVWLVNLHDADRQAHTGDEAAYLDRVQRQAAIVKEFYTWLEDEHPDYLWQLQMVITADHGRHRHNLDGGWANHGDSCTGCRGVPLFILGGGVKAGELQGSYTLHDVAPTLAAHLGIDLPYAEGLPLGGKGKARSGGVSLSGGGSYRAVSQYQDDLEHRSVVAVNGEVLSSPDAFAAEAPTLVENDSGAYVCFRELVMDSEADDWPWTARCFYNPGSGWQDIGFPDANVGPFFKASMQVDETGFWIGYVYTPLTRGINGDYDAVRVARWTPEDGWGMQLSEQVEFTTTEVSLAKNDDGFRIAAATSLPEPDQAYSRRVVVWDENAYAEGLFTLSGVLGVPRRAERPALSEDGTRLAMLAISEEERGIAWSTFGDKWGETGFTASDVLPHITPQWVGDTLIWGAWVEDEAALCRASGPGEDPSCVSVGAWEIGDVDW